MGKTNPEKLIDDLINFIDKERMLYGDFPVNRDLSRISLGSKPDEKDNRELSSSKEEITDKPVSQSNTDSEEPGASGSEKSSPTIYDRIDACETLDELEKLCRQADVLKTDLEDTRLVFGVGNPEADLVLVGEAPGAEEDRQGEPFVGKAGQLLNKILKAIDFEREDVYITNILKHRPPNNRNPKPEERKRSLPFLLRQIDLINPKLILSLGKISAQTLLDNNGSLSSMRGTFHPFREEYQLLATYHPAALLRHAHWKRPTWEDVQLLRERYDELGGKP